MKTAPTDKETIKETREKAIREIREEGEIVGEIGVDSGLVGFFVDKPDYSKKDWRILCQQVFLRKDKEGNYPQYGASNGTGLARGVWSESGFGDGSYDVLGIRGDTNRYYALLIDFIRSDCDSAEEDTDEV